MKNPNPASKPFRNSLAKFACTSLLILGAGALNSQPVLAYVPPGSGGGSAEAPAPPPAGPTNLTVTLTSGTAVTVKWTDPNDSGITLYKLYRNDVLGRTLGKTQVTSESTGAVNGTYAIEKSFRESGLGAGQNYTYKVEACYTEALCSPPSNSVTVVMRVLAAPTGVTATPTATTATIGWTAVTGATSYKIYNGTTLAGTVTSGTSYEATGLTAATAYNFTVVACDDSSASNACSAESTAASFTTAAATTTTDQASYPTVTVADATQAVITGVTFTPPASTAGVPGAVYVAAIISGNILFLDSNGQWQAYIAGKSPAAYFTGNLGATTLNIIPTPMDLSAYSGAQILVGYGKGIAPLSSPFDNMLTNTTYDIVYTVE